MLFSLLIQPVTGQDYVQTTSGKILHVQITEVNLSELKYRNKNDSIIYSIPRSDVSVFKYGSIPVDTLAEEPDYIPEKAGSKSDMYLKGVHDAEFYYLNHKAAANGTFWSTVFVGPGPGLIPALITSSIRPTEKNLGFTDSLLMKNPEYYRGYAEYAKEKKVKKVWRGYLGGMAVHFVILLLIFSSSI